jgi:HAE1 family hydrophobic/amphiphilic exporter-1
MKGLIRLAATRPIGLTLIYIAVVLFGLVALRQLAVDLLPSVDMPRISITTRYEGVAPEDIETLITRPMEQATSTVEGVERIEATSSEGISRVQLQFAWGTRLQTALDDVRVAVDRLRARLPDGADAPTVFKFDLSSVPVAFLGLTGDGDQRRLKYLAQEDLSRALERLPGIASIDVTGGRDREIRVSLDPARLSAVGVSAEQVAQALARENRTVSAGNMLAAGRQVVIRTEGEFGKLADIEAVVVATRGNQPIRVGDLGAVVDTIREVRGELFIDGTPGIRMRVFKQSDANTVEVVKELKEELGRLNQVYEGRAQLGMLWDSSDFIRAAVTNVQSSAGIGAILAALVLLVFLRSVRATLVVATAIPVSIIATFALMHFQGMTLNVISFGGLALGVGMLVDGAIVILENIYRKRSEGLSAFDASIEGAHEVGSAVVAGTLTTVAVFAPVVFMGGFAGVFFSEMAEVVTFALACSLIVALTLVPMLAGRLLSRRSSFRWPLFGHLSGLAERLFTTLERLYQSVLVSALALPWAVVVGAVVLLGSSVVLTKSIGTELMPSADEGRLDVSVELAVGTPLETTNPAVQEVERRVRAALRPGELEHVLTTVGPEAWWRSTGSNEGQVGLVLVPAKRRSRSLDTIEKEVTRAVEGIPGVSTQVRQSSSNILTRILRRGADRLSVEIRGHDLARADALAEQVTAMLREVPGVTFARPDVEMGQLERVLRVDRARAAELGLGGAEVAAAVEAYVLGRVATRYRDGGDEFDIRVGLSEAARERLEQLPELPILTPSGQSVPLHSLVTVDERRGPSSIQRVDQERVLRVSAGTTGRPFGEIAADVERRLLDLPVPDGFRVGLGGELAEQKAVFAGLFLGILLACFLVYTTMAVQFESALHPLIVMVSVPFAFIGVVLALILTGTTFNMNSFLGSIMLVGIVVNNAIVLVDYTNRLRREQGFELHRALVTAASRRLRPILMTTLTTVLALLPLALGTAEGSEIQAPLARAVVGGLVTSSLVTLLLVPSVYYLLERRRRQNVHPLVLPTSDERKPAKSECA